MALKTKKFADDEIVVAWQAVAHGDYVVRRGERLRGDHPVVKSLPGAFVADGTPLNEMPGMWENMGPPPEHEPEFHRVLAPIPDEEAAIAQVAFTTSTRAIAKGERLHISDELVQQNKHLFKTAPLPIP